MNKEDMTAYYKWDVEDSKLGMSREYLKKAGWKGACEYKQIEIDKLKAGIKALEDEAIIDADLLRKEKDRYKTLDKSK